MGTAYLDGTPEKTASIEGARLLVHMRARGWIRPKVFRNSAISRIESLHYWAEAISTVFKLETGVDADLTATQPSAFVWLCDPRCGH